MLIFDFAEDSQKAQSRHCHAKFWPVLCQLFPHLPGRVYCQPKSLKHLLCPLPIKWSCKSLNVGWAVVEYACANPWPVFIYKSPIAVNFSVLLGPGFRAYTFGNLLQLAFCRNLLSFGHIFQQKFQEQTELSEQTPHASYKPRATSLYSCIMRSV